MFCFPDLPFKGYSRYSITNNSGETIFENIMNVVQTLVLGLTLAMLVLVLFLGDWRAALIVATSMPLSVFAARATAPPPTRTP